VGKVNYTNSEHYLIKYSSVNRLHDSFGNMKSSTLVHNDECTIYGLHLIAALYMSFVSVRFSPLEVDM